MRLAETQPASRRPHTVPGTKNHPKHLSKKIRKTLTLNRPAHEIYDFITNINRFMSFIKQLESAKHYDVDRWKRLAENPPAEGPPYLEITNLREDRLISWRCENADVDCAGSIRILEGNRGSEVTLTFAYNPPVGDFASAPHQLEDDFHRFKQFLETGEIATNKTTHEGEWS